MTMQEPHVASDLSLAQNGQPSTVLAEKPTPAGKSKSLASRGFGIGTVGRGVMTAFHRGWRRFLAVTRLSSSAICEESVGLVCYDYHTYADDIDCALWFMEGGAKCKRCQKQFRL
jgi:hypothetical protein